ncbi:endonuclease/exonuclease/phosphatase family protein [Hyphomonas sp.]|uniref:endonuclease/exonuclease/phosphatase family protein n=1 Tax=Hyphomonas sp. TaxID=87 RepID=UPI003919A9A0
MRIVNWNIERHAPSKWRAKSLLAEIAELDPDVLCLTEAWEESAAALGGHAISAPGAL